LINTTAPFITNLGGDAASENRMKPKRFFAWG